MAVELKNDLAEFKRFCDQASNYRLYADQVYLACTPHMAAEYVKKHAMPRGKLKKWDPEVFNDKLKGIGCGLLLVLGDEVQVGFDPPLSSKPPLDHRVQEVIADCERRRVLAEQQGSGRGEKRSRR